MKKNRRPRRVVVTSMGVVSPLGDSPGALHAALGRGESGLRSLRRCDPGLAPPTTSTPESSHLHLLDGSLEAGEVAGFSPQGYLGKGNLRPLDRTARLATVAAHLALEAGSWTPEECARRQVGLVLGTMFGSVRTISEFDRRALVAGPSYAKPFDFANSVINAAAGQTAIWHRLTGINTTVAGTTTAGLQALACATEAVRNGRAEAVLAGGAEELCFESLYGLCRSGLVATRNGTPGCPVPFHPKRNGCALAEGAALLVLEDKEAARRRGATVVAEIGGYGSAYDGSRGSDPKEAARALARAVRLALDDAAVERRQIAAWSASANGSVHGDHSEAMGILAALGDAAQTLPVTAIKSMLGESLGAAAALQTLVLVESLNAGSLPGIRGLPEVDPRLPLKGVRAFSQEVEPGWGLVTATGLQGVDGNACALLVRSVRRRPRRGPADPISGAAA